MRGVFFSEGGIHRRTFFQLQNRSKGVLIPIPHGGTPNFSLLCEISCIEEFVLNKLVRAVEIVQAYAAGY